jgi:uncharacterized protein (TIGR02646 family)
MFHEKCAYCERSVEDKGDIEHYIPKSLRNNQAIKQPMFDWDNLLLCCHDCNHKKGSKMEWDGHQARLLNPCQDDPLEYLKIDLTFDTPLSGRMSPQDNLTIVASNRAQYTYTILGLNERGLPKKRLKIFRDFQRLLKALIAKGHDAILGEETVIGDTIMDTRITVGNELLELLDPASEYLAAIRQFLHEYPKYKAILIERLPQAQELLNQWNLS